MSANITSKKRQDGLEAIKAILEYAKNPQAIIDAAELERQQATLTEDEKARSEEARANIKQYQQLIADLKSQQTLFLLKSDNTVCQ